MVGPAVKMSRKPVPPNRSALAIEYLIWSLLFAVFVGTMATLGILLGSSEGLYDPQGEIANVVVGLSLPIFLIAIIPLGLMALWRRIVTWSRRGYVKLQRLVRGRTEREPCIGLPSAVPAPESGLDGGAKKGQASMIGLILEYCAVTVFAAPIFGIYVFLFLGGYYLMGAISIAYIGFFLIIISVFQVSFVGVDMGPLGPFIFPWSMPIAIAAVPASCMGVRLLLKALLARVRPGKRLQPGSEGEAA